MKLNTSKKDYALTAFYPSMDGCVLTATEAVTVGDVLRVTDDDGELLREYTVADYLRCVVDGCMVTLTNLPAVEPTKPDLDTLKAERIADSKAALEAHLTTHPLVWVDGKRYSVTAEKQALLNNALAVYQLAQAAGAPVELTWNATGEECTVWTFDALCGLALAIAAYVKPLVAHQQALEVAIRAAQTVDELEGVVIDYATAKNT